MTAISQKTTNVREVKGMDVEHARLKILHHELLNQTTNVLQGWQRDERMY